MAQSGNGADIGSVYALLTQLSSRTGGIETKLNELVGAVNEHSRRFDELATILTTHSRKLDDVEHRLTELRDAVGQHHYTVIGHGIAVNQLEERVKLLEEHLGLGSPA